MSRQPTNKISTSFFYDMTQGINKSYTFEKEFKIWISLIKNLGIKRYQKLIQELGSKKNLWNASETELQKIEGIGPKLSKVIANKQIKQDVKRHLDYMQNHSIDIISIDDKEYPELLKQIYNPPLCLYIIGKKEILNDVNIAIVGSRDATEYGKSTAKDFAYKLAINGVNVVSGLARGIDSYAHIGALSAIKDGICNEKKSPNNKNKIGKTIAVLGNGLDTIFPYENTKLAENIIKSGGCIISEYPLGTGPNRENFPARNRIISGLCNGVLVIEAKLKSGTMITIDFALEQGRDVFAIPGNIDSINSMGTNELIRQGAKLVTNYKEIIEEYIEF